MLLLAVSNEISAAAPYISENKPKTQSYQNYTATYILHPTYTFQDHQAAYERNCEQYRLIMTGSSLNSTVATIIGTTIAVGSISSLGWWYYYTNQERTRREGADQQETFYSSRRSTISNFSSQKFKPPFPQQIRDLLSKSRFAYLSTVDSDMGSSHLSLMRFTYLADEVDGEVVIMSTNRKTKKFDMLQGQRGVALLVHDFLPTHSSNNGGAGGDDGDGCAGVGCGVYSITLNGNCRILENGSEKAERYRQEHLKHNPEYPQFIVGEDIVILCVDVTSARICDVQDQVIKWNVQDGLSDSCHDDSAGALPRNN